MSYSTKTLLVSTMAVVILGVVGAVSGYFLGASAGPDLDAARLTGQQAGEAEGSALGAARGYKDGLRVGERRGYRRAYRRARKVAYKDATKTAPEAAAPSAAASESQGETAAPTGQGSEPRSGAADHPGYEDDGGALDSSPPPIGSYDGMKDFCRDQPEETECGGAGDPRE